MFSTHLSQRDVYGRTRHVVRVERFDGPELADEREHAHEQRDGFPTFHGFVARRLEEKKKFFFYYYLRRKFPVSSDRRRDFKHGLRCKNIGRTEELARKINVDCYIYNRSVRRRTPRRSDRVNGPAAAFYRYSYYSYVRTPVVP